VSRVVVFGTGRFAECVHFYLTHDSEDEVVAFSVEGSHLRKPSLLGLPVVPFEELEHEYPPGEFELFVAVGYAELNRVRARIYEAAKTRGYGLVTYVSSRCTHWPGLEIGDNCFIFEDNTIQPFVEIGNDVVMWSGNHIGHHSRISDHCFLTSHVVVSGNVTVGAYSFLGVNATIRDSISVGERNVIGAGALVMRPTQDGELYVAERTRPDKRTTNEIEL
jgi:sugar O-acyltransferase (sialic acid O-acetyltransferase NeuD family)